MTAPGVQRDARWSCSERGDALDLREVCWAGEEVIERLYFALRDGWWRTVPMRIVEHERHDTADGFRVATVAESEVLPMRLWLRFEAAGPELRADVEATALADFDYARVGLCLLLGQERLQGQPARARSERGEIDLTFPREIVTRDQRSPAAVDFHRPFEALELQLRGGGRYRLRFEGESFELEDQRNWSDPSYKAYSATPEGGPPLRARAGQVFAHGVSVRPVSTRGPAAPTEPAHRDGPLRLFLGPVVGRLPSIGLYRGQESARPIRPPGGFHELNAAHALGRWSGSGAADHDAVELGVNGSVHAADDESVMATTRMHGRLAAQARAMHPRLPLVMAPLAFGAVAGDWRDGSGRYMPQPPTAADGELGDPRWLTSFAATWVTASAASAVSGGPAALRYLDASLPATAPAAEVVERLGAMVGRPVLEASVGLPLLALAVADGEDVLVAVANTGPRDCEVQLPDGQRVTVAGFGTVWSSYQPAARR